MRPRKLIMPLIACLLVGLLGGCSVTGGGDFCAVYRPVFVGDGDVFTDKTAEQILRNNEIFKAVC